MRPTKYSTVPIAVVAGLACLVVYLRAIGCDFVSYDDPDYVLHNPLIRQLGLQNIRTLFTSPYNGWWMPLTWISLAVDYHFWALNPFGYHLTNILLHSVNTGLVVLIADKVWCCKTPCSSIEDRSPDHSDSGPLQSGYPYLLMLLVAGLIWGIHPLRVESVAWVTERKDVLNGLLTLSSVLLYLGYVQNRGSQRNAANYVLSLIMFVLSLLAKSISIVLPLMLLVIDWYPHKRFEKERFLIVVIEKIPFFLIAGAMAFITIRVTAQAGYLVPYAQFPFGQRIAVSGNALFEYCLLGLYPFRILPLYLIPDPIPGSYIVTTVISICMVTICVSVRNRTPWFTTMFLLFVLPLIPVLAFFQNGDQSYAARFTYLPMVGISIGGSLLAFRLITALHKRGLWTICCVGTFLVILASYAVVTVRDIAVWQDSEHFWSRVIAYHPDVVSYRERGRLYTAKGQYDAAVDDLSRAIGLATGVWQKTIYNLYAFRGNAYLSMGRFSEAVQDFTMAITLYPHPLYFYYRGVAFQQLGNVAAAAENFVTSGGVTGQLEWFERGKP